MEVEKILARPRRIRARMEEQRERVDRLEAFAQRCTSSWSDTPGGHGGDARYDAVAKLVEERKKLLGLAASYQDALWAVNDLIERLPKERMQQVTMVSYLKAGEALPGYFDLTSLFLGGVPGSIGEISALALLAGAAYLLIRKVITWRIPTAFIGTVAVLCLVFGKSGYGRVDWTLYNLLSGGLILGAFFMATDYSTSPVTLRGQLLFGVGCGALTVLIRYFGSYPEGVSYAILIMNCCAWAIDRVTRGRQFGVTAEDVKAARQAKKEAKKKEKEAASA